MNPFTLFRISVVAPFVLSLAAAVYSFTVESSFSQEWKDLFAWNGDGGMIYGSFEGASATTWTFLVLVVLIGTIGLLNQIPLFFYWKPSRPIFLVTSVLLFPAMLFFGLSIMSPIEAVVYELSTFISGICLALAYYSPVAERFSVNRRAGQDGGGGSAAPHTSP